MIVKFLYTEGRLPNVGDTIISFTSYPIGSSLFVYYATLIGDFSDTVMLVGQFILIFSCVYALFAVVRDESRNLIIAMLFSFIALFNYFNISIRMNNLLVDFVLPMMTLAGLAGLYSMQRKFYSMSVYFVLIAGALSLVKNSALFFVAVLLIYYISRIVVNWSLVQNKILMLGAAVLSIVASMIPYYLWNVHVKSMPTLSKHEVSFCLSTDIWGKR